ncbi:hypothetical protein BDL97_15G098100 [Sphagnum fallax]|nr:hypothetical protein BDL97_15G098100 [Sphagnum fallax]
MDMSEIAEEAPPEAPSEAPASTTQEVEESEIPQVVFEEEEEEEEEEKEEEEETEEEVQEIRLLDLAKEEAPKKALSFNVPFVEISGPDGMKKRFATGTKASFAVDRFNSVLKDPNLPVVCIAAVKEGEDPIEFGPDVELILFDATWTLQIVQEAVAPLQSDDTAAEEFTETNPELEVRGFVGDERFAWSSSSKAPWVPIGPEARMKVENDPKKVGPKKLKDMDPMQYFGVQNWEDLYPGGKLPEGGQQECTPLYIGKIVLVFIFIFAFAGGLSYMLERLPEVTQAVT